MDERVKDSRTVSVCKNCGENFCYICSEAKDIDFCSPECEEQYRKEKK